MLACTTALVAVGPAPLGAEVTMQVEQGWTNAWEGAPLRIPFVIKSDKPLEASLAWTLRAEHRVLARGQTEVKTVAGEPKRHVVAIDVPPVREAVVLKTELLARLIGPGEADELASHGQPLWIFPRNPYSDRRRWLEDLSITLFDPAGTTTPHFEKAGIPFHVVRSQAALDRVHKGTIVIGEGASLAENADLADSLFRAAARGVPVLCLAPAAGDLSLAAGPAARGAPPRSISLRQFDIVEELDKRLDAKAWQGQAAVIQSLRLRGAGDDAVASVMDGGTGWPWLEMEFPEQGRLIVCGFAVVRRAQAGPAPSYLLLSLLQRLDAQQTNHSKRK